MEQEYLMMGFYIRIIRAPYLEILIERVERFRVYELYMDD